MMSHSLIPTLLNSRRKQSGIFSSVKLWYGGGVWGYMYALLTEIKKKDKDLKQTTMKKLFKFLQ